MLSEGNYDMRKLVYGGPFAYIAIYSPHMTTYRYKYKINTLK
jgi:hypothetical protein